MVLSPIKSDGVAGYSLDPKCVKITGRGLPKGGTMERLAASVALIGKRRRLSTELTVNRAVRTHSRKENEHSVTPLFHMVLLRVPQHALNKMPQNRSAEALSLSIQRRTTKYC